MMSARKVFGAVVAMIAVLGTVSPVQATLTFDLNTTFSGSQPDGTPPYLRITFTDQATTGVVRVTFSAIGLVGSEKATEWDFNLNPLFASPTLNFDAVSGNQATASTTVNIDKVKANGHPGFFDIEFGFSPSGDGRLTAGETASWDITCTLGCSNTLDETDFNFLAGNGTSPFHTAAHIQSIANEPSGDCSGWIADGAATTGGGGTPCGTQTTGGGLPTTGGGLPTTGGGLPTTGGGLPTTGGGITSVPVPGTFMLIGSGLLGLGLVGGVTRMVRRK